MNFRKYYSLNQEEVVLAFQHPVYKKGRGCQDSNKVEFDDFGYKAFGFEEIFEMIEIIKPDQIFGLAEEPRGIDFEG